ncbi:unnamed protein product [Adineta ricciae]|uniref:ubiquitinyl hydrolase 1 n=1 Tax=Adineta ricciae TaxID=249248 RepID=A0A814MC45_ADIRI|nr:unnamed protein product [Adineta ricciae]CAF1075768.1 unnamed protein product [Adineta ricciae]
MEKVKARTGIYHEHQDGFLCGQHALNNLLQSSFFTADALADIARELDVDEKRVLYHKPCESENVDDTGFYNIQVLQIALKMFDIELISFASQDEIAKRARQNPTCVQAFVCNLGSHWFSIRRFGSHYFDLNSIYYVPHIFTRQTLPKYLNIIQDNGYSVFIVAGTLPVCLADRQLEENPISAQQYELLTKDLPMLVMDKNLKNADGFIDNRPIMVPRTLLDEYRRNPNDPEVKRKFNKYLPSGLTIEDVVVPEGMSKSLIVERLSTGHCNCPNCRSKANGSSASPTTKKSDDFEKPVPKSAIMAQQITNYSYDEVDPNDADQSLQRQYFTTSILLINASSMRNNRMDDDLFDEEELQNADDRLETRAELLRKTLMLQQEIEDIKDMTAIADKMNSLYKARAEYVNETLLATGIAASLADAHSNKNKSEKKSEPIPLPAPADTKLMSEENSPVPPLIDDIPPLPSNDIQSAQHNDMNPSESTTTNSSPSSSTIVNAENSIESNGAPVEEPSIPNFLPLNNTDPQPSGNAELQSSVVSKDNALEHDTPQLLSPIVDPDVMQALTIEEIRQRRLRLYGNRNRSIISPVPDVTD